MKGVVIAVLACGLIVSGASAGALPCDGIDRPMSAEQKSAWAQIVAAQLQKKSVNIHRDFSAEGWSIVYAETTDSDPPFLFFKDAPERAQFVTLWSGAATIDEEHAIRRWVVKNAPGIPKRLAACFAWFVTPPHRDE